MTEVADLLGAGGPFAARLAGFAPRPQQQQLAEAVSRAVARGDTLIAEAGTGTGKTFAYLVPALLSGKRLLISTGTRALQDQLFHRDLPAVSAVLGMPVRAALLKGRANYLCRHRLALTLTADRGLFDSAARVAELARVRRWAQRTASGDLAEIADVAENSPLWPQVTSTAENCLGQECGEYGRCFVLEARRQAQQADLVVINHHLLLADLLLKTEGFGSLLPGAEAIIVDEAHQLPDIAAQYFGSRIGSRPLQLLLQDLREEYRAAAGDLPEFEPRLTAVQTRLGALQQRLAHGQGRIEWGVCEERAAAEQELRQLGQALAALQEAAAALADRSRGLGHCAARLASAAARLGEFLDAETEPDAVRWLESHGRHFALNLTPLDTAARFQSCLQELHCGWVFLSATLSIAGSFAHFRERLGLSEAQEVLLDSPFDYAHNALLYLPSGMPEVNDPTYTDAVVAAALPLIEASGGRAFLLFTSHRALAAAAERLRPRLGYPLLVQGEAPRRQLLERFRELGNAVLLGTASFWEGVDVKGPALSLVVIDRLPFASPGDPLLKARLAAIERVGREPFMEYQLPQAVLALKQGVGRLIRDSADTGVMMICDPRLTQRGYGRVFLDSLPPMRRCHERREAEAFLAATRAPQAGRRTPP